MVEAFAVNILGSSLALARGYKIPTCNTFTKAKFCIISSYMCNMKYQNKRN
jgi:hypothetical protein